MRFENLFNMSYLSKTTSSSCRATEYLFLWSISALLLIIALSFFPPGCIAASSSDSANGSGTLQKNSHTHIDALKGPEDEIFRKIDWLTKTVEEKDHENKKFRLKFSRKVHTLENKVLRLEQSLTHKVNEVVQKKLEENSEKLTNRNEGKKGAGNDDISDFQSHQPSSSYTIRYPYHHNYGRQNSFQKPNSWGFYEHPITQKRVREPATVYGFELPTRDLPRLSLVASAGSIPMPQPQLPQPQYQSRTTSVAPQSTLVVKPTVNHNNAFNPNGALSTNERDDGATATSSLTISGVKLENYETSLKALRDNVAGLEREVLRLMRSQNKEDDNTELHKLLVENAKEIKILHQKHQEMISRVEHFAVEMEKAAARREHVVNETLREITGDVKRQIGSMKAYTKRHIENVTAFTTSNTHAAYSQTPDKLKCAQTLLDELMAQISKPKSEQSSMYQMDLADEAVEDVNGNQMLMSYAASRDPNFLTQENLSKELKLQRKQILELKSDIGRLNISQILVMRTVDEETLKRTVRPRDCSEIRLLRNVSSGVYSIFPRMNDISTDVYCDMETNGGGWTVIQRRGAPVDDSKGEFRESFVRGWEEYENGFGALNGDFWLGLSNISSLCQLGVQELRIDLTNWSGETRYANYQYFKISNVSENYKIHVSGYSGTAGDSLARHNGMGFSTPDSDHDADPRRHCAKTYMSGWWYYACFESNLNGLYVEVDNANSTPAFGTGIIWQHWMGSDHSLKHVEMKMRNTFIIGDNQYLKNMFNRAAY